MSNTANGNVFLDDAIKHEQENHNPTAPLSREELKKLRDLLRPAAEALPMAFEQLTQESRALVMGTPRLEAYCRIFRLLRELEITPDSAAFVAKALLWHCKGRTRMEAAE